MNYAAEKLLNDSCWAPTSFWLLTCQYSNIPILVGLLLLQLLPRFTSSSMPHVFHSVSLTPTPHTLPPARAHRPLCHGIGLIKLSNAPVTSTDPVNQKFKLTPSTTATIFSSTSLATIFYPLSGPYVEEPKMVESQRTAVDGRP